MFKENKDKLIAVLFVLLGFLLFSLIKSNNQYLPNNKEAYQKSIDSLKRVNDSLSKCILYEDTLIKYWTWRDSSLNKEVSALKKEIVKLKKIKDTTKQKIDSMKVDELVGFYNERYPEDTSTNKIELAKPVLKSAAKDLIELDYSKQIIGIQDSLISVDSVRIVGKDSIIASFGRKEIDYKNQISNFMGVEDNYKKIIGEYKLEQSVNKKKIRSAKVKAFAAAALFVSYIIIRN